MAPPGAATPAADGGPATANPGGSSAPGGVLGDGGPGDSGGLGPAGKSDRWLADVAAPIGYLALVLIVAFVIARRRVARSEQAALATSTAGRAADSDAFPVHRSEPRERPIVADDEEDRPRWLRASLRAERAGIDLAPHRRLPLARPLPPPPARAILAFGGVPAELDERRRVRLVGSALLDQPDGAIGRRLLELEPGDEVAIMDRDRAWVNVLTPTGEAGWLPESALEIAAGRVADARSSTAQAVTPVAESMDAPGSTTGQPDEPFDLAAILAAGHAGTRAPHPAAGRAPAPGPPAPGPPAATPPEAGA